MTGFDKSCHILAALLIAAGAANAHPLEDLAERAMSLCSQFDDVESVEYCGVSMGGASPERKAARRAVRTLLEARSAFVNTCVQHSPIQRCIYLADWYVGSGMSRLRTVTYELPNPRERR